MEHVLRSIKVRLAAAESLLENPVSEETRCKISSLHTTALLSILEESGGVLAKPNLSFVLDRVMKVGLKSSLVAEDIIDRYLEVECDMNLGPHASVAAISCRIHVLRSLLSFAE